MAFLDFIKERFASKQQPVADKPQPKPETAQQWYARQDAQERATQKPIGTLPPATRERLDAVRETLRRATQHHGPDDPPPNSPAGGAANREAMRQNMTGQVRTAPALSPTGTHAGMPESERISPPITPKAERPKTLPRTPPSWER